MGFINIGFDNMVPYEKIVAITTPDSASVKRLIQSARENQLLIDVTSGRKTRAVVFTTDKYVLLSAIHPETLANRLD